MSQTNFQTKKLSVWPGLELGSHALKAGMITTTPPALTTVKGTGKNIFLSWKLITTRKTLFAL